MVRALEEGVLLYPVYALLFADTGLTTAQISSLFAIWSVVSFVCEIPAGALADVWFRKRLYALGQAITAAGFACWLIWPSYTGFALGFILWGAGGALSSGTLEALVYDELGDSTAYARLIGRSGTTALLAMLVATLLAAPAYTAGGYLLVGLTSIATVTLGGLLALRLPENPRFGTPDASPNPPHPPAAGQSVPPPPEPDARVRAATHAPTIRPSHPTAASGLSHPLTAAATGLSHPLTATTFLPSHTAAAYGLSHPLTAPTIRPSHPTTDALADKSANAAKATRQAPADEPARAAVHASSNRPIDPAGATTHLSANGSGGPVTHAPASEPADLADAGDGRVDEPGDPAGAGDGRVDGQGEDHRIGYLGMLRAGLREATGSGRVARALLVGAAVPGFSALDEYLPLLAREKGAPTSAVPLLFALVALAMAAGSALAGRVPPTTPRPLAGALALAAAMLALGSLVPHLAGMVAVAVAFGLLQFAMVHAETRLQETITGPARTTVLSISGFAAEVCAVALYAGFALPVPLPLLFGIAGIPLLATALLAARR